MMTGNSDYFENCDKLPQNISDAAKAAYAYIAAVSHQQLTCDTQGRWFVKTSNFATLKPQWKRAKSLAVTLRGNPNEFEETTELTLQADQNGYSICKLESPEQIASLFVYLKRAQSLFEKGSQRKQTSPKTVES